MSIKLRSLLAVFENKENTTLPKWTRLEIFVLDAGLVSRKWATWGGCRYPQHELSIWKQGPHWVFSVMVTLKMPLGLCLIFGWSKKSCIRDRVDHRVVASLSSGVEEIQRLPCHRSEFWIDFWWCLVVSSFKQPTPSLVSGIVIGTHKVVSST